MTGIAVGTLHTVAGPDHLAGLAPLVVGPGHSPASAFGLGALWGSGHATGQLPWLLWLPWHLWLPSLSFPWHPWLPSLGILGFLSLALASLASLASFWLTWLAQGL